MNLFPANLGSQFTLRLNETEGCINLRGSVRIAAMNSKAGKAAKLIALEKLGCTLQRAHIFRNISATKIAGCTGIPERNMLTVRLLPKNFRKQLIPL